MTDTTISRYRGDTAADEFTIVDEDGAAVDITGYSFVLTVNTLKNPPDDTTELYAIAGDIVDAPNGVVEFVPTDIQADQNPGKYYYDVQMTDAQSRIRTVVKGTYKYTQDISK
jgi:hypothetical protein